MLSSNALTTLQEVGLDDTEVECDIRFMSRGGTRNDLLELCLDGADGEDRIAAWTEYVDAVCAKAVR